MPAFQERILYHSQNKQKYNGLKIFQAMITPTETRALYKKQIKYLFLHNI